MNQDDINEIKQALFTIKLLLVVIVFGVSATVGKLGGLTW